MDIEQVRKFCLSLPHVTEKVQWGNDLLFCIGGKMFVVVALDASSDHCMSFKCTPERFAELIEQNGIVPAPYVARYYWVALERFDALSDRELKELVNCLPTGARKVAEEDPSATEVSLGLLFCADG